VVLDSHEDNRGSTDNGDGEKSPVADELSLERRLPRVQSPHDSRASGLNALVETNVVCRATTRVGERAHEPVDTALPCGVVEAVEDVQEHGTDELLSAIFEVNWDVVCGLADGITGVEFLVSISTTPCGHGEDEKKSQCTLSTDRSTEITRIETPAEDDGADDLSTPVQDVVESTSADVEDGAVDGVLLVWVEPVRRPEHGEEENDQRLVSEGFPETNEFRFPARVFHEDDFGAVRSDNVGGIAQAHGNKCTKEHENNECDIGAITDVARSCVVDVLTKWNLSNR
jgi:hypothetical protein